LRTLFNTFYFFILGLSLLHGQDISLLHSKGKIPSTYINPALPLDNTFNLGLANINFYSEKGGPVISDLTSKNNDGSLYIDIKNLDDIKAFNYYLEYDIRTLDVAFKFRPFTIMAGHGFRSSANITIAPDLIQILKDGNAPYIGQHLELGPNINVLAFNELYLGLQKAIGRFTLGARAKLLFGTSSVYTERSHIGFTTLEEYYQLQFDNDYLIRSSSFLKYDALDDITIDYTQFTFDNLFYNNRGFAVDLGAAFDVSEHLTLTASALDLGYIKWDYSPRKYELTGEYTFEGVDIIDYLEDSTLTITDTLYNLLDVKSSQEKYSTTLNKNFTLGAAYTIHGWSFNALYQLQYRFDERNHRFSVSAAKKLGILDIGAMYSMNKNNFKAFGIYTSLYLKPVYVYASTQDILGLLNPLDARNISFRFGASLQF